LIIGRPRANPVNWLRIADNEGCRHGGEVIKVLFTGGGGAGNEALFRLLGERYILHFGDADTAAIDPSIPKERRHELAWASDPEFVEKVAGLCRRLDIDLLIPGVDEELLALARNADALAPTRLLLPDEKYVETMIDKLQMVEALAARKVPVPLSHTLADDLHGIRFPCISKPRRGRGSRDVRVLASPDEAVALKRELGDLAREMLVQEKIEGVEYTVQMVADSHGHLRAIVPVKVGVKRGITLRAETEAEPRVMTSCRSVHQSLPTSGCYNIQLILTPEGRVFPFEINPRVSTTLCLVVAAGIDPISIFLGDLGRGELLPFVTGMHLQRHWANHFSLKG
jgi:carbamoyl-phosphate synthase large subunit